MGGGCGGRYLSHTGNWTRTQPYTWSLPALGPLREGRRLALGTTLSLGGLGTGAQTPPPRPPTCEGRWGKGDTQAMLPGDGYLPTVTEGQPVGPTGGPNPGHYPRLPPRLSASLLTPHAPACPDGRKNMSLGRTRGSLPCTPDPHSTLYDLASSPSRLPFAGAAPRTPALAGCLCSPPSGCGGSGRRV